MSDFRNKESFKQDISCHSVLPKVNKTVTVQNWCAGTFPK